MRAAGRLSGRVCMARRNANTFPDFENKLDRPLGWPPPRGLYDFLISTIVLGRAAGTHVSVPIVVALAATHANQVCRNIVIIRAGWARASERRRGDVSIVPPKLLALEAAPDAFIASILIDSSTPVVPRARHCLKPVHRDLHCQSDPNFEDLH